MLPILDFIQQLERYPEVARGRIKGGNKAILKNKELFASTVLKTAGVGLSVLIPGLLFTSTPVVVFVNLPISFLAMAFTYSYLCWKEGNLSVDSAVGGAKQAVSSADSWLTKWDKWTTS